MSGRRHKTTWDAKLGSAFMGGEKIERPRWSVGKTPARKWVRTHARRNLQGWYQRPSELTHQEHDIPLICLAVSPTGSPEECKAFVGDSHFCSFERRTFLRPLFF
jgi:hypothetical protein